MINVKVKHGTTVSQKMSEQAKQKYTVTKFQTFEWETASVKQFKGEIVK